MILDTLRIKFLGKTGTVYRVLDKTGEVLRVFETKAEAEAFING